MSSGGGGPVVVRRLDETLAATLWPEAKVVDDIVIGPRDCLVVAMGFEERALAVLQRACRYSEGFHLGLVSYLPTVAENREQECRELVESHGLSAEWFEYDRQRPAGMGRILAEYASGFEKVFIDISGMSRLLIVQTIVAMGEMGKTCEVLYSEAAVYPPTRAEYTAARVSSARSPAFISSGVLEVVSSPELSSVGMLGSPIRLISFLSFDSSQLRNLVQEIQPTHNDVVCGLPPHADMAWRRDALIETNEATVKMLRRAESHEVCTFDYRMSLKLILAVYGNHSVFDRIVIAPTGSKMQALAVGVIRSMLKDVQIVYPTPRRFLDPRHYTDGVRQIVRIPMTCWGS